MDKIDFRSDTVSWPTPAMRAAMADAALGDDVYGEDPTVNALEARAAEMVGMEAGLFVASGTMGNLVAILSHATRGDEAIVGQDSHTYVYEAGGMATLGGIVPRPLPTDAHSAAWTRSKSPPPSAATTRITRAAGCCSSKTATAPAAATPFPPAYFQEMRAIADAHNLRLHLDGARSSTPQRAGFTGGGAHRRCRLRLVLFEQRIVRPGRFGALRQQIVHQGSAPDAQIGGRRHAPGRRAGGRGIGRAG
jgi:threonine aldolase